MSVIERAKVEAERFYPLDDAESVEVRYRMALAQQGYVVGYARAATITPERIEAGARALYEEHLRINGTGRDWPGIGKPQRDSWRAMARAALRAAGFVIEETR